MVTVYTAENCMPCKATLRKLDKLGVAYEAHPNTELSNEELDSFRKNGIGSFPIVITPTETWGGYFPDKLQVLGGAEF